MQEYRPRKQDLLVSQILRATKDVRSVIISGPPGVGKTSFTRWFAREVGAVEVYFLAHHWVSEEDLFVKLDPARVAALAGGIGQNLCIDDAYRPGVLLRASLLSQKEKVVLILDEWDKSPDRCDALLLEFLQQGRIVGPFGEEFQACLENLFVFITTNGMRQLSEPLLRRCLRYDMSFLPPETEADVIRRKTGVPITVARLIVACLLYTSPSPRDRQKSRMPSSA